MSEKIELGLPRTGFDGLEEELDALSHQYGKQRVMLEPSADLDAAILAASRREIHAGPLPGNSAAALALAQRRARAKAWKVPLSLAAMLILCGTIGIAVWKDKPDALTPGALSAPPSPAPASSPQVTGAITTPAPLAEAKQIAPTATTVAPDRQNLRARSAIPAATAGSRSNIVTDSSFRDAPVVVQTHQNFAAPVAPYADAASYDSTTTAPRGSAKAATGQARPPNAPMASAPLFAASAPSAPVAPAAPAAAFAPAAPAPGPLLAEAAPPIVVVPVLPSAHAPAPRAVLINPLAIVTEVPAAGSSEQLLIAALSAAVDRGDAQAAREILESLHQQFPQVMLTQSFAARVTALGLDPAH